MPKVSIIVPVYNVEPYLRRCIDSILAQSFADFELILVDDGSTDACGAICDEYVEKDERILVIHQENGGLSAARNTGIKASAGEYLLFCDSDDYVSDTWCDNLVNCISRDKKKFIFGGIHVVYHSQGNDSVQLRAPAAERKTWTVTDFFELQGKNYTGYAWNVLYDAEIVRDNNLLFSKEYIIEDLPFNLDYLNYVDIIEYSGAANYYYVQDERQTLSRKYYPDSFRKWREKYALSIAFLERRLQGDTLEEKKRIVANSYLYVFLNSLDECFDKRNPKSFFEKIKYNQAVVCSTEFQNCLSYADGGIEDKRYIWLLKQKNYPTAWVIKAIAELKQKWRILQ